MFQHLSAGLTPRGNELPCGRVDGGMRVAEAARMAGFSRQTARKWLRRCRDGEPMSDRGCRPRRLARLTHVFSQACVSEKARPSFGSAHATISGSGRPLGLEVAVAAVPRGAEVRLEDALDPFLATLEHPASIDLISFTVPGGTAISPVLPGRARRSRRPGKPYGEGRAPGPRGSALLIELLNFSCSRCSVPGNHADHFLVSINNRTGQRRGGTRLDDARRVPR